jgi:tetratricopeptide (TPR) repeat protein
MKRSTLVIALGAIGLATFGGIAVKRRAVPPAMTSAKHPTLVAVQGPVTTSGVIAMRNLESDLLDAEITIQMPDAPAVAHLRRSGLVYLRARVTGDLDEMARAISLTDECIRRYPNSAEARIARASQLQTLHKFREARADLEKARELGAAQSRIDPMLRELDWNAGKAGPTAEAFRAEAVQAPTQASLARLARLEHDLGNFDAADALYTHALGLVSDLDPIPVAMLELQRGMNAMDAGRLTDAESTFRNAAARLPAYTAAREHLAEVLHRLNRDDEAIALYESITKTSTDPEFVGALAALYRAHGRVKEADSLRAKATQRYDELLALYPDAMAWHAAEYFGGEGNNEKRALSLLEKNAELRPNAESLDAFARALRKSGAVEKADALHQSAEALRQAARPREGG